MQEQALEGRRGAHTMREQTYRMEGLVKQLLTLCHKLRRPGAVIKRKVDVPMMRVVGVKRRRSASRNIPLRLRSTIVLAFWAMKSSYVARSPSTVYNAQ